MSKFKKSGGSSSSELSGVAFEKPPFFCVVPDSSDLPPVNLGCSRNRVLVLSLRRFDFVPRDSEIRLRGTSIVYIEVDRPGDIYPHFFGYLIKKVSGPYSLYGDTVEAESKPLNFPYITFLDINDATGKLDSFFTPLPESE